jgi:broad specificity phosphatase PhoE
MGMEKEPELGNHMPGERLDEGETPDELRRRLLLVVDWLARTREDSIAIISHALFLSDVLTLFQIPHTMLANAEQTTIDVFPQMLAIGSKK